MTLKTLGRHLSSHPVFNPLVAPLYNGLIAAQISAVRVADFFLPKPQADGALLADLTLVVKTFERTDHLRRLLQSVRRMYPTVAIVVVDDSRFRQAIPGVDYVVLPFDSGVSAGRNAGLARVGTRYVMILDDDFVFYRRTDLVNSLRRLAAHERIDILAGAVVTLPAINLNDSSQTQSYREEDDLTPARIDGLEVRAKVPNFFLARAERLRKVGWDPQLKRLDHMDFFHRAAGVLCTVFDPRLRCLHAKPLFNRHYMRYRTNFAADLTVLRQRYPGPRIEYVAARLPTKSPLTRAEDLLRQILASRWDEAGVTEIERTAGLTDPASFAMAASLHGLVGVLRLECGEALQRLPESFSAALRARSLQAAIRAMEMVSMTIKVARALESKGIPCLPLKGSALSTRLYGDPLVRQSVDVDMLVDPDDLATALDILRDIGLVAADAPFPVNELHRTHRIRSVHHINIRGPEGLPVELHWRTDPSSATSLPPLRQLLPRLQKVQVGPLAGLLALPDNLLLDSLASHACRSCCARWKWCYDIALLVTRTSGGASPWRPDVFNAQTSSIRYALATAAQEWQLPVAWADLHVPKGIRLTCKAADLERKVLRGLARRTFGYGILRHAAVISAQPTWRAKVRYAYWAVVRFPADAPAPLYTAVAHLPLMAPVVRFGMWAGAKIFGQRRAHPQSP